LIIDQDVAGHDLAPAVFPATDQTATDQQQI
jgi:hypothetical protein